MIPAFRKSDRRRGAVAVFVMVTMLVLLGCTALAVDVGHMYVAHEEMQNAMDSSALAGASGLFHEGNVSGEWAQFYATRNQVAGVGVSNDEAEAIIGYWEGSTRTFYPFTGTEPTDPNAVRTIGTRPDLPLFFAKIMGISETCVMREAVATSGSGTCAGIWGLELIDGDGNLITDSYDSSLGDYGPGNIRAHGDICSNKDIVLEGGVEIHGDAMNGDDYSFTAFGSSFSVWGVVGSHTGEITPPDFDIDAAQASNDNASIGLTAKGNDPFGGSPWDFVVSGNDSLALPTGTFYFTSALVDGQATVTVTGPTIIFLSGPATFTGGGLINVTQDPKNLIIYSTGDTMTVDGNAGFYGGIVAPYAEVNLTGTSEYFGTIMARVLNMFGDTTIHVDEQLAFDLTGVDSKAPILVQ